MKFFKRLFWFTVLGVVSWWGWKFYERIRATIKLSTSLPMFLKNTVGDKPGLNQNITFNSLSIALRFDQETLDREENLEQMVREYIEDFYPTLAGLNLTISIEARAEATVVEPEVAPEADAPEAVDEIDDEETEATDVESDTE